MGSLNCVITLAPFLCKMYNFYTIYIILSNEKTISLNSSRYIYSISVIFVKGSYHFNEINNSLNPHLGIIQNQIRNYLRFYAGLKSHREWRDPLAELSMTLRKIVSGLIPLFGC